MTKTTPRSPLEVAADLLVYAPVGLALQVGKALPGLAEVGRSKLETPLGAARVIGEIFVKQHQHEVAERLRQAADWAAGAPTDRAASDRSSTPRFTADEQESSARTETVPVVPDHAAVDVGSLAIPGYSTLSATQVIAHLSGLSADDLKSIRTYEAGTRKRRTVLQRIDELLAAD